MITGVCTEAVVVAEISLAGVALSSYARAGTVFGTDISTVAWVEVMADVFIDVLARTVTGVVPDITVSADVNASTWLTMVAVLEFMP